MALVDEIRMMVDARFVHQKVIICLHTNFTHVTILNLPFYLVLCHLQHIFCITGLKNEKIITTV
jgi:hypothetical protein